MNEQMEFPETWEEYEQEYGFNDSDEVYTNNSRLIQSFRVKQWLDHLEQEPCEDAISRQAVLETIDSRIEQIKRGADEINKSYSHLSFAEGVHDGYCRLKCDLRILPPVTPQPKIGKWIVDGSVDCYLDKVKCHCSECGKKKEFPANYDHIKQKLSISYKYPEFIDNYCPNCGAKMLEQETKINEDISKGFEEFTRMMFRQGQEESMTFSEKNCNTCGQKCAIKYHGCSNWMPTVIEADKESEDKDGLDI